MDVNFEKFFEQSLSLMCVSGTDGYFKRVNPAFTRVLGWSSTELLASPYYSFMHPEDRHSTKQEVQSLSNGEPTLAFENRLRCRDGSYRTFLWTAWPVTASQLMYGVAQDVTEFRRANDRITLLANDLQEANAALARLAETDSLTGLANRRALDERLIAEINLMSRMQSPISVLMIDVDHFKPFNDAHGHLAGDDALRVMANELGMRLRVSDALARFGGEEFAVVLPDTGKEGALDLAEELRAHTESLDKLPQQVTISVGVSSFDFGRGTESRDELRIRLLNQADQALYQSKSAGRNRVTHYDDMA